VHSKKTKVMACPQAGNNQALLGLGRRWFFDDLRHFVDAALSRLQAASNRSVKRELAFVRGLDGRDGAPVRFGNCDELFGAALGS
jgi:hypothetical protein